jgi:Mrp family chromosome partitioning ATPase
MVAIARGEGNNDRLRESFDFVIVVLPPLVPIVDASAAVQLVDCVILVIEWGVQGLMSCSMRSPKSHYCRGASRYQMVEGQTSWQTY